MKIDGIELLEKIKNEEIKEGTRINCSRFGGNFIHIVYEENELKLYYENDERYDEDKCTGVIAATDLLKYTFEIIEEDKEIEKIDNTVKDGKIQGTYATNLDVVMVNKINEIIDKVNELKKEGK